jgi:hypothetical protein
VILTASMAVITWTQADVDALREAIVKLATGKRVVSVSYAGPPARSISYQIGDIAQMRELLAEAQRAVGGGATYRLASTRKGLGC